MRRLLSINKARSIMHRFSRGRVLVIGDLIMDHFVWGNVVRISPEAPVPVVDVTSETVLLGGSANVVNNIKALGGRCLVAGVVGRDEDGKRLVRLLKQNRISTDGIIVDTKRPTTTKTRVIAHSQQVVRFDREKKEKLKPRITRRVLDYIKRVLRSVDIVVISDYSKGLITKGLVEEVVELCCAGRKPIVVDPKVGHFDCYAGTTVVTPNNIEASLVSGIEIVDDRTLHDAGELLLHRLGCEALLITRGEHGMSLFEKGVQTHIPTVAKEVYDVSGAGDTVVGALALAMVSGAGYREAAVMANFAAGVVVGKVGTATLSTEELNAALSAGLRKS